MFRSVQTNCACQDSAHITSYSHIAKILYVSNQEFDGYKFRDLIVEQWGAAYDIQIKREMFLGKPMV